LASNSDVDLLSPSFATAVGLLMKGLHQNQKKSNKNLAGKLANKNVSEFDKSGDNKIDRKSIFEKWADKFREFLDNAE